jgi:hypothetical protein
VRFRQTFFAVIAVSMVAALVGCSSGSKSTTGGTNPITVSVSANPTSVATNGTSAITATVTNDSANAGVTFTVSCSSSSCGAFSAVTSTTATYTAPSAAPSGGSVTITATSVSDTTKTATATISITTTTISLADGNYVFSLLGTNTNGSYSVAGVFNVKSGAITGGEQDFSDNVSFTHDLINATGSSYTTTADGNLQITLVTCNGLVCTGVDPVIGPGADGIETINGTMTSSSTARLIEFDASATSSGMLGLQDATAATTAPAGGYAFEVEGAPSELAAIGGILNISGTTVSPTGTVFDLNSAGNLFAAQTISSGSITAPDSTGRVQIQLISTNGSIGTLNFVGYIVDATHVQLLGANFPLAGTAYAQTGSLTIPGNSYVIALNGFNANGVLQLAGVLTLGGGGNVTGTVSFNDLVTTGGTATAVTGIYVTDPTNLGRVSFSVTDGALTFNFQMYVDGNGNAPTITLDTGDVLGGAGYQQTASSTFSGTYAMAATGADGSAEAEFDSVGSVTTGSGTFASGTSSVDLNWFNNPTTTGATQENLTVSGAFSAPSGGVSTGSGNTITGLDLTTTTNADVFDYYVVDSTRVVAVETDANQLTLATFEQ